MRNQRKIRMRRRQWDEAILDVLAQARREGDGWMASLEILNAVVPGFLAEEVNVTAWSLGSYLVSLDVLRQYELIERRAVPGTPPETRVTQYRITDEGCGHRGRRLRRAPLLEWLRGIVSVPRRGVTAQEHQQGH